MGAISVADIEGLAFSFKILIRPSSTAFLAQIFILQLLLLTALLQLPPEVSGPTAQNAQPVPLSNSVGIGCLSRPFQKRRGGQTLQDDFTSLTLGFV